MYTDSVRKLKWGVVALVAAALVATVLLLTISHIAAFAGFVAMVGAAVFVRSTPSSSAGPASTRPPRRSRRWRLQGLLQQRGIQGQGPAASP